MNNKKETTQKHLTANQLIEATKATTLQKGEAMISVIKQKDDTVHIKWSGTGKALLDSTFTLLNNDMKIAAIVCRAAKDYIETLKGNPQQWMRLTQEVAAFDELQPTTNEERKEAAS